MAAAERLAETEIAFIDHQMFRRRNSAAWIEAQRPEVAFREECPSPAPPGIVFLAAVVRTPLLSPAYERYLFLKMNFLRYQAEQKRRKLRPHQPDAALVAEIETCIGEAVSIRNIIAEANVRLLVAEGRKLCHTLDHLGELLGEGFVPLLRAIDLFDVGRGHRFSTYLTWAVRNQMIRTLRKQRVRPELALTEEQAGWNHIPDGRPGFIVDDDLPSKRQSLVARLCTGLSERERQVIRARFGLDGEPSGQSLAEISARIGLSKERVRQLALSAVEKLRLLAEADGCDPEDELVTGP